LNNEISATRRLLNSFRISCDKERREIDNLYHKRAILEAIVTEFKNSNEEYVKIKLVVEEKVKGVLTNSKVLLNLLPHQ